MLSLLVSLPLLAVAAARTDVVPPPSIALPDTGAQADLVLHNGKIVTVDERFQVAEGLAVKGDRILAVGSSAEVLFLAGPATRRVNLEGRTVLPGLIDSHSHPPDAAMYEFDHPVPDMQTVADVLAYVKSRADALEDGQWIVIQQVFITRLREPRFPTRQELDEAAPRNPVFFRTGPDAAVNSLALELSGIGKDFKITDGQAGYIERDPKTGEPTGILRNCSRFVKHKSPARTPTDADRYQGLKALMAAYNEVGITGVTDRGAGDERIATYKQLMDKGELTCRVFLTYYIDAQWPMEKIQAEVLKAAGHPLRRRNGMLWLRGIKFYLDGGMLTGSAYMREPWGVSDIYSITDPEYKGLLFVEPKRLAEIARIILAAGLQPTAHTVGDGAVHALIDAYETVNRDLPVRDLRPCISHANFTSVEAIHKMHAMGIVADMQPAWLYLDGGTLLKQFGERRTAYFQPYRTLFDRGVVVGGGSDHMQKLGSLRSINPYNPFLGMWTTLARQPRWTGQPLHTEQRITRQEAIRLYTINNACLSFEEKEKGSLEPGKLADFVILDKDILTCGEDEVKDIGVLETWLGGKRVYERR
ncbi:MAG: amidohydrolase [Planctomycetes bacterium]|nr:amidohydrolase [Planctomycetota bacterium]